MNYSFIAFIFVCLIVWLTAVVKLSQMPRPVTSIFVAVMFLLIFLFYGRRWFYGPSLANNPNGSWPPVINMCPDYLVHYVRGGRDTCVDLVGVSKSGTLKAWTQDDSFQNPPADDAKYFPYTYKPTMTLDNIRNLQGPTLSAGLTWEGITPNIVQYDSRIVKIGENTGSCGATVPGSVS